MLDIDDPLVAAGNVGRRRFIVVSDNTVSRSADAAHITMGSGSEGVSHVKGFNRAIGHHDIFCGPAGFDRLDGSANSLLYNCEKQERG